MNEVPIKFPFQCPHCQAKLVIKVRMPDGFAITPVQKITCVKCRREFSMNTPGEVVGVEEA